jgi:hypothetical protein
MSETDPRPLIVTLKLDATTFARLDDLRRAHFPPALNRLSAHLTLFHHLPGERRAEAVDDLADVVRRAPLRLRVSGLRLLGRGVAFDVDGAGLVEVRRELARRWGPWLSAQDRQGFRAHVTVQNKVDPAEARRLRDELAAGFSPWDATGEALQLWRYLGGPWEAEAELPFHTRWAKA